MISQNDQLVEKLIPEKIRAKYYDFEVIAEASYYKIFQATSNSNLRRYAIRALDLDSCFVKSDINAATTLFLQEILCLCLRLGKSEINTVRVEDFALDAELNQIGFVMSVQRPLRDILSEFRSQYQLPDLNVERLLRDVASDLDFVYNRLKSFATKVSPETIFYVKEADLFFLGDWASVILPNKPSEEILKLTSCMISPVKLSENYTSKSMPLLQIQKTLGSFDSGEALSMIAHDVYNLGLIALEACGINKKLLSSVADTKQNDIEYEDKLDNLSIELAKLRHSELVRNTILQMLQKDQETRISLDEVICGRWKKIYIAWSSFGTNRVGFQDVRAKKSFEMQGAQLEWGGGYTLIQKIPQTNLVISTNSYTTDSKASFDVFRLQAEGVKKFLAVEKWIWDIAFNARTNRTALLSVMDSVGYHIYNNIDWNQPVKKAGWPSIHTEDISGLDFDPSGEHICTIDRKSAFEVSKITSKKSIFSLKREKFLFKISLGSKSWSITLSIKKVV